MWVRVRHGDAGKRLDLFLVDHLRHVSRSSIQRWMESGHVTVNGNVCKPSHPVRLEDEIQVLPPAPAPVELVPEPIPLSVVYEDDALVVIDKPAGLVVHPGAGNPSGTLANALVFHFEQFGGRKTLRPGIVHRLDKQTSGLLVVAKTKRDHEALARQFQRRQVEKRYLALVYGRLQEEKGVIDLPIGRDTRIRTKISTRSYKRRAAVTEYRLLRHLHDCSYVEVRLRTGRTHQIRVHFQHLGHPVVGDTTYGGKRYEGICDPLRRREVKRLNRHFLHAALLSFSHPRRGGRVTFESTLPRELARLLSCLE
ncbi:MAG: RluA family pseudouridine synthase [Acidobacteriota bacterium]